VTSVSTCAGEAPGYGTTTVTNGTSMFGKRSTALELPVWIGVHDDAHRQAPRAPGRAGLGESPPRRGAGSVRTKVTRGVERPTYSPTETERSAISPAKGAVTVASRRAVEAVLSVERALSRLATEARALLSALACASRARAARARASSSCCAENTPRGRQLFGAAEGLFSDGDFCGGAADLGRGVRCGRGLRGIDAQARGRGGQRRPGSPRLKAVVGVAQADDRGPRLTRDPRARPAPPAPVPERWG
jgi:hypothetical protein